MKYVFEDTRTSMLHEFMRKAYDSKFEHNFIYTGSNGKLLDCISVISGVVKVTDECIRDKYNTDILAEWSSKIDDSYIFVYIDIAPTNVQTVRTYELIREFIRSNNLQYRVFILPIPCIEYPVLLSLIDNNVIVKNRVSIAEMCKAKKTHYEIVNKIVDDIDNWDDILISMDSIIRFNTSFEKVCKSLLKLVVLPCARTDGDGCYYNCECACDNTSKIVSIPKSKLADRHRQLEIVKTVFNCSNENITLTDKITSLFRALKNFPSGSMIENTKSLKEDEYIRMHQDLVDELNRFITSYIEYMNNNGLVSEIHTNKIHTLDYCVEQK